MFKSTYLKMNLFAASPSATEHTESKIKNTITITVSNGLVPDQDRHYVAHDLGPTVCKDYQQMTYVETSG